MLVLSRKVQEKLIIGDGIEVSILEIKGDSVKLGINAPATIKVFRFEIFQAIQEENRLAAASTTILPKLNLKAKQAD